ncbi:MAG: alpha/beta fold hydrolase [Chloroflexi bacterium]|nr:MAG: alpha/beta fold hydrolase [Chloroflexota bacterium]
MREGWVQSGSVDLHYLEWNAEAAEQPALFLLHGLSSNARIWDRMAQHLDRRLIALDQRAHGRSPLPPAGFGIDGFAADAVAAITRLGLGRPVLAGHSWGGAVALQVAATHPELASGLAIVDFTVQPFSDRMSWTEAAKFMQPPLPLYADLQAAYDAQRSYVRDAWAADLEDFVEAGLVKDTGGYRLPLTADVRLEILDAMFHLQSDLLWPQVAAPSLLAMAEGMPSAFVEFKRRATELAKQQVPETAVHWYRTGHDVPLEDPAGLARDLERLCLRASYDELALDLQALAGDWARPADGYAGWTAKDLLAHLSSSQAALPRVATSRAAGSEAGEPFDSDRWNASQLRKRQASSPDELRDEFSTGVRALDPVLSELPLEEPIGAGTYRGLSARDAMRAMLAHQRGHLDDLTRLLG